MLQASVTLVPFTQGVFGVPAHTPGEWTAIIILAITPVTLIELGKLALRPTPRDNGGNDAELFGTIGGFLMII